MAFFFATFFVLVVLLAGCGGQSGGEAQDNSSGKTKAQNAGQKSAETRVALGRITNVRAEDRRLVVRLNTGDQSEQRVIFVVMENAGITLDGQEATLEEAKRGQQVQMKYVVKKDRNRAREVVLFGREGAPGSGGTTG